MQNTHHTAANHDSNPPPPASSTTFNPPFSPLPLSPTRLPSPPWSHLRYHEGRHGRTHNQVARELLGRVGVELLGDGQQEVQQRRWALDAFRHLPFQLVRELSRAQPLTRLKCEALSDLNRHHPHQCIYVTRERIERRTGARGHGDKRTNSGTTTLTLIKHA